MSHIRIKQNFTLLSLGEATTRLLAFLITVYISRILGVSEFGVIAFATSVLAYGTAVVDLGFTGWGKRESARAQLPISRLAGTVIALRLCLVPLAFAGIWILSTFGSVPSGSQQVLLIYAISLITDAFDLNWVFLGTGSVKPVFWSSLLGQIAFTALIVLFAHSPAHIILIPVFYLIGRCVTVAMLLITFVQAHHDFKLGWDQGQIKRIFSAALPFSGTHVVSSTYAHFDIIFVGLVLSTANSGYYGVAYRVLWVTMILAQTYFTAISPVIARSYITGVAQIQDFLKQSLRISLAMTVGILVGGVMLAKPLILFLFGADYLPAVLPFQILLVGAFGGLALTNHERIMLDSYDHQRINFFIFLAGTSLNILLNILMVPLYGIVGAALALLISRMVIFLASYFCVWKYVQHVPVERYLLKPLAAAAAMAGVLSLINSWHVIVQVAVGTLVFLLGLVALGIISPSQIRALITDLRPTRSSSPESA